jgi:hypothetical protein
MGDRQRAAIEPPARDVLGRPTAGDTICSFSAINRADEEVWVQLIDGGSLNTLYPFDDEPMRRLGPLGVFGTFKVTLIEWEAGNFATFDIQGIASWDVAFVIDQLFVKLLQCDDAGYQPASSFE